jgi:hypothetical protein
VLWRWTSKFSATGNIDHHGFMDLKLMVLWNIWIMFPYIGNVIILTDFCIFQRGCFTTNQKSCMLVTAIALSFRTITRCTVKASGFSSPGAFIITSLVGVSIAPWHDIRPKEWFRGLTSIGTINSITGIMSISVIAISGEYF